MLNAQMNGLIDSHCHLAGKEFLSDLEAVVARAREAGVDGALTILAADDAEELARAPQVAAAWDGVRFSIGVHPHAAGRFAQSPAEAAEAVARAIAGQPLARAVGEIGLDYHYDFAPRDTQRLVFAEQIQLAQRLDLPVVIHTREAEDDTFAVLAEAGPVAGVFHCFTGDLRVARRALDAGFHVSLSGIVTFPRATELKEVAAFVPTDRLLVETDSPFLAPVPHRGTRNEPAYVGRVCQVVAELRGTPPAELASATSRTFSGLFNP
ncbi:MAG TPA: TatD family hydrolase [Vicinamibacterales bacterium]